MDDISTEPVPFTGLSEDNSRSSIPNYREILFAVGPEAVFHGRCLSDLWPLDPVILEGFLDLVSRLSLVPGVEVKRRARVLVQQPVTGRGPFRIFYIRPRGRKT